MIVLCKNCHGRKKKTSDPRHINRASLKKIKSDLMMLNGRYSDLERRIIDEFRQKLAANPCNLPSKEIPELLSILVQMMVLDGIVTTVTYLNGTIHRAPNGTEFRNNWLELTLTEKGRRFIDKLAT